MKLFFGIILTIILVSLGQSAPPKNDDAQLIKIERGMENFSLRWSKEILKNIENGNLVSSGVSTALILAMAALGASGNTKIEIQNCLGQNWMPKLDKLTKNAVKNIIKALNKPKKLELKIANRIFTRNGFEMNKNFKEATRKVFDAEAQSLDFYGKSNESSKTINDWVESKTNNRIKNLVSPADVAGCSIILINTIYFSGNWQEPFNPAKPKLWHVDDKNTKNVLTMDVHGSFEYGKLTGVDAKYLILPYESWTEERYSMFVIIPNKITGLKNIEANMKNIKWNDALKAGQSKNMHVTMPKFKIEKEIDIKPILQKMGMNDMFSDRANFSGITKSEHLEVSRAIQKVFIDVNEKGSEAAAATALMIEGGALIETTPEKEIYVKINRPFLFLIVMEKKENVRQLLFSGRVVDPEYK